MTNDAAVVVFTTFPVSIDAQAFARTLVDERLAACVTILGEALAVYRWRGDIHTDAERQLLIKSTAGRLPALEARVRALHPYEVPEFLVVTADGASDPYLNWIRDSVGA